jgi:hypothetical protein
VKYNKKYNINWTDDLIDLITKSYPHYGLEELVKITGIERNAIRSKTSNMKLKMLPKEKRLCIKCKIEFQKPREYVCNKCFNEHRRSNRMGTEVTLKERFLELLRSARYRSSEPCDLDLEHITKLYEKQNGKCFYTGFPMEFRKYGSGRNMYSVSMDRIDSSKGYTKKNVVLCCFAANSGKNEYSITEYIKICRSVVDREKEILQSISKI